MFIINLKKIRSRPQFQYFIFRIIFPAAFFVFCSLTIYAQRIIFVAPPDENRNSQIEKFVRDKLSDKFKVSDDALAESVRENFPDFNFYNLTLEQAKTFGRAAGCNFFIVTKSATLRRASLAKKNYWESYAVFYLVSSRTGKLSYWKLISAEADNSADAEAKLAESFSNIAVEISARIKNAAETEISEKPPPKLAELPPEDSSEAKGFRAPLPFRRLKPEYTETANLYGIAATIEATVDLDETGAVTRIEISRWAGYGLDEAVAQVIRQMQWRSAEHNGKTLPVRVLLRYNFKKIEGEN